MAVDEVPRFTPSSPVQFCDGFTLSTRLPSTSDAFQFFPNRSKNPQRISSSPQLPEGFILSDNNPSPTPLDIDRLRSDAFCELHRSVAESDQGLVSRMRDWEGSLPSQFTSHSSLPRKETLLARGRHSPCQYISSPSTMTENLQDDEDDDIQVVSGDASYPGTFVHWGHPNKKRALSMSVMEVDHASIDDLSPSFISPESSERCSSPVDLSISENSFLTSDDECVDTSVLHPSKTPALTSTNTNSATSSLISLPLPPSRDQSYSGAFPISSTASREEKAIAALTLAMANGAAGLNDYADIRLFEENRISSMDESLIGEMWH